MATMEGNRSPLRRDKKQSASMLEVGNRATYPIATCRLASKPYRPVQPAHQLLDVPAAYLDRFRRLRFTFLFDIKEFQPHEHQPPAYFTKCALDCRMDSHFLRREQAHRNARCLRRRASTYHSRGPPRVG